VPSAPNAIFIRTVTEDQVGEDHPEGEEQSPVVVA